MYGTSLSNYFLKKIVFIIKYDTGPPQIETTFRSLKSIDISGGGIRLLITKVTLPLSIYTCKLQHIYGSGKIAGNERSINLLGYFCFPLSFKGDSVIEHCRVR